MARHGAYRARSVPRTLGLTLLSALFPGSGYLMAGRPKLGAFVLTVSAGLAGLAAYAGLARREQVVELAVDPRYLLAGCAALVLLGVGWIAVVVSSHRLLRPASTGPAGRFAGALLTGLLCFAIAAPAAVGAQSALAQRDLVRSVFAPEGKSKSATREKVDKKNPWAKIPRLNLLLLGADDGAGRKGTRTDTVIVASIDTRTGATALVSLPRNTIKMPFPEDSPLHDAYPDGFWKAGTDALDPKAQEYYLDAMYRNIPAVHRGVLGQSDNEGADVLKVSVGEAVGLKLHYYLQVNLEGFEKMIDALGGITVNIDYKVPVGGDDNLTPRDTSDDKLPSRYLQPGPDQHLKGFDALWFARGRYRVPGSDKARQIRQRCTIKALVTAAEPKTVVTNYQAIAKAGEKLLRTDIPQEVLPSFVELALKVKTAKVSTVEFGDELRYGHPDFEALRATVSRALKPSVRKPSGKPGKPAQAKVDECAYHPTGG